MFIIILGDIIKFCTCTIENKGIEKLHTDILSFYITYVYVVHEVYIT